MGWVHPWVGLGQIFIYFFVGWVGLGWVQKFWVGLGFEKVTHDQLCTDLNQRSETLKKSLHAYT